MKFFNRTSAVVLAVIGLGLSAVAGAAPLPVQVTNYNFDSQNVGDLAADGTVQGGFPTSPPRTGTVTVQNVGGMNKAAHMVTTQGGIGANYLDTSFSTGAAPLASVDFDLNLNDVPTSGIPQATTAAPGGQAWVMQTFGAGPAAQNRVFRFVAAPTSATGGTFGMRNNTDGDVVNFGSYAEGTTYHIQILADFTAQNVDVYLDNALVLNDHPFVNPTTNMQEHSMFQNGIEGQTNSVAVDNIVTAIPEPASIALVALGGAALLLRRRRRSA